MTQPHACQPENQEVRITHALSLSSTQQLLTPPFLKMRKLLTYPADFTLSESPVARNPSTLCHSKPVSPLTSLMLVKTKLSQIMQKKLQERGNIRHKTNPHHTQKQRRATKYHPEIQRCMSLKVIQTISFT